MRQMPTHDIQKVIFDKNYIKFTKMRQAAQEQSTGFQSTIGFSNKAASVMNNSGQYATQLPPSGPSKDNNNFQMNRLQYVQYECIKTELKEEYEQRVNFLNKRIEKR